MCANITLSFVVRPAVEADSKELGRLMSLLGFPVSQATMKDRLSRFLGSTETALVAATPTELLGAVTLHITPVLHRPTPVGRLTALVVDDRCRRRGVGRALVLAAEELFTRRGCALVEVTSNQRLSIAHLFYEQLGYERTSFRFGKVLHVQSPAP